MMRVILSLVLTASAIGIAEDVCVHPLTPFLQYSPTIGVFGNKVFVVFEELIEPFKSTLSLSYSLDGGDSFLYLGSLLSCPDCEGSLADIAISSQGNVYIAYTYPKGIAVMQLYLQDIGKAALTTWTIECEDTGQCGWMAPSLAADESRLYLIWNDIINGQLVFSSASIQEMDFAQPKIINASKLPIFARLAVDNQGSIYCIWLQWPLPFVSLPPFGFPDKWALFGQEFLQRFLRANPVKVMASKSVDKGRTWSEPKLITEFFLPCQVSAHDSVEVASFVQGGLEPWFAPAVGADRKTGVIYIAFQGAREDGHSDVFLTGIDHDLNVVFVPRLLSMDTSKERFSPVLAVSEKGTIGVAFYELDLKTRMINVYLAQSTDGGLTFAGERVNAQPWPIPPVAGQPTRSGHFEPSFYSGYVGKGLDVKYKNGVFYLVWTDFRNKMITPLYPQGRADMDIYFLKLPAIE